MLKKLNQYLPVLKFARLFLKIQLKNESIKKIWNLKAGTHSHWAHMGMFQFIDNIEDKSSKEED